MKKNYILSLLLFLWATLGAFAQNITVNTSDMPTNVVACGDASTFKVNIYGPLSAGSVVKTTLPNGARFKSLLSGNVTATSTSTGVNFALNSQLSSASDVLTIEYQIDASCSMSSSNANVLYEVGSISKSVAFPTVQQSLLEVTTVSPASATITVFGTQNYNFTIKQSANTYATTVKLLVTHSTNVSISTALGALTLGTPSGNSQTDVIEFSSAEIAQFGNGNGRLEQNEELKSFITAKLLGCTSGETISFRAAYGCGTFTSCQTGNTTSVGLAANVTGDPSLTMSQTKKPWPGFLTSDYDTATFVLKNNGTGPALNVRVQYGFANNGYVPVKRNYLDFYDFTINGNPMSDDANDLVQFDFTSDPDGVGVGLDDLDGDGFYDDLPPGASVTINAKLRQTLSTMNEACRSSYYNGAGTSGLDTVRWRLISTNSCKVDKSFNENNDSLGTNSPFTMGIINQTSDIVSPNGNVNFDSVNNTFTASYNFGANASTISSGAGFMVNGQNAFWRVKVVVPAGLIPNPSVAASYSEPNKFSLTYNAAISDPSNHIYYYDLKPTASNQGDKNLQISGRLDIPLMVDSSCNSNGVFNVKFSSALWRDTSTVFIPELGCITSPNFSLGCGTSPGLAIESFDLKRQTFGFLNSAGSQVAQESDIDGTELNHYLNGDKAVAAYRLKVNDATIKDAKLYFEYDKYDWLKDGIANGGIKAISGSYTNPSNGVVTNFSVSAAQLASYYTYNDNYVGADGKAKSGYVFDVMKLFQSAGPLASASVVNNAIINYNVHLLVNQDLQQSNSNTATDTSSGYMVNGITTYPKITFADNTVSNGNFKSDKAIVFAYFVANSITGPSNVNIIQCQQDTYEVLFNFSRNSKFGDLFKKEFRYNARVDRLELLIPKGITYTPGTAKFKLYGETGIAIANPTISYGFNENGTPNPNGLYDKLIFVNPGNWPMTDATKTFDLVSVLFDYTANNLFRDYIAQQSNGQFKAWYYNATGQFSLNFDSPRTVLGNTNYNFSPVTNRMLNYTISSAAPNPTTATNTASWPLTVTNQSTSAIPNFWVAVEVANDGITPTLWDGNTQIPMVSYGAGKYWAKVGTIASGSKTFTLRSNDFTICGTGSFKVKTSFECSGYPENPESGFDSQGNRAIWTQEMQMSITTQNPALTAQSTINQNGNESFGICTPVDESLLITNGANGYAYRIEPTITFPTGMVFVPGSFKVNYNGVDYSIGDPTLVSGSTFKVNIYTNSSLPFAISGLPGTSNTVDSKNFVLKYQLAMVCFSGGVGNYISGSRVQYDIPYQSGCQAQLSPLQLNSQAIEFGGGVQGKTYVNSLVTLENPNTVGNHHINDGETMQVTVINQGESVSTLETIKVFVDPAYDYKSNSFALAAGNNFSGMPSINEPISQVDAAGQRQLVWTIPTGFSNQSGQNTIQFTFELVAVNPKALDCEAVTDVSMNTFIGRNLVCEINGNSCSLEYPTGTTQKVILNAFKPSFESKLITSSFSTTSTTTSYSISYELTNINATYEIKSGLRMRLFDDANGNGVLDAGETLLDTQYSTLTVPANQTAQGSISGQFASSYQNFVLVIDSNPTVSDVCNEVQLQVKSACYKPAQTSGATTETKHGITALGRAGSTSDNWPMVRRGAWTVLESQTKGFVINRLSNAQVGAIPQENLVVGMMVYNTDEECLMINTDGTLAGWKCYGTPSCPN